MHVVGLILLELFTSEGCSSCPPADAVAIELASDPNVVALELHVDYWDDLGWKDPFSQRAFSERQALYQARFGARGVYTPEMVVNGAAEAVGSDKARIRSLMGKATPTQAVTVSARRDGDAMVVRASGGGAGELWVAVAESGLVTQVPRGENAGRKLAHGAVVRRLERAPATGELRVPVEPAWKNLSVVAFTQDPKSGRITGAGRTQP
jgi:hypothetical protein